MSSAVNGRIERALDNLETMFFLTSRDNGRSDMLHYLGCRAPSQLFEYRRVSIVWALLRIRHPLLASTVEMHSYTDIRFLYQPPRSIEDAINDAESNLDYRRTRQSKDEFTSSFIHDGPRILSSERLSYLVVSAQAPQNLTEKHSMTDTENFDIFLCAAHCTGDGIALRMFFNEFLCLIGGPLTTEELTSDLSSEWRIRCGEKALVVLPASLEDRLPQVNGRFRRAVTCVDFRNTRRKLIGGQLFPEQPIGLRKFVTRIVSLDEKTTEHILKRCKTHDVSISNAIFAICNIAWARTSGQNPEMPTMMYSPINLRPYLRADKALHDSYFHTAMSRFHVILPSFFPPSDSIMAVFWSRAHSVKKQSICAAKHPMAVSRWYQENREWSAQARAQAKAREGNNTPLTPSPSKCLESSHHPIQALLRVSSLGNLDNIYQHSAFENIHCHETFAASRLAPGVLLTNYTFIKKLWIHLRYHTPEPIVVERFWENLLACIDEFLVS